MNLQLQCAFCPKSFPDFGPLGSHVKADHPDVGSFLRSHPPEEQPEPQPEDWEEHGWFADDITPEEASTMNVGKYIKGGQSGDRLPLLDAKLFKKLQKAGIVTGKMISCREIHSPKFDGLAMDFKHTGGSKFSFLARFDRYDIGALALQCDSEDTDDWIGMSVRFFTNKSSKGSVFVNVVNPKSKKKSGKK